MVVDLPAPFGPSRATVWPRGTVRPTPSTARTAPKLLLTPRSEIASPSGAAAAGPGGPVRGAAPARPVSFASSMSFMPGTLRAAPTAR